MFSNPFGRDRRWQTPKRFISKRSSAAAVDKDFRRDNREEFVDAEDSEVDYASNPMDCSFMSVDVDLDVNVDEEDDDDEEEKFLSPKQFPEPETSRNAEKENQSMNNARNSKRNANPTPNPRSVKAARKFKRRASSRKNSGSGGGSTTVKRKVKRRRINTDENTEKGEDNRNKRHSGSKTKSCTKKRAKGHPESPSRHNSNHNNHISVKKRRSSKRPTAPPFPPTQNHTTSTTAPGENEHIPEKNDGNDRRKSVGNSRLLTAVAYKNEGNRYYAEQDYERAVEAYTKAMDFDTTNPVYLGNRAAAKLMMGLYDEAAVDCETALKLDRTYVRAKLRAARAYIARGETVLALPHLESLLETKNIDVKFRQEAQDMVSQAAQYEKLTQQGDQFLSEEKANEALSCAERASELSPASRRAWLLKIACKFFKYATTGVAGSQNTAKQKALILELDCLIQNDSCRLSLVVSDLYKYGKILLYCALSAEAKVFFKACTDIDKTHERAKRKLSLLSKMDKCLSAGAQAFQAGRYSESIEWFDKALKLDSSNMAFNGRLWFRRAAANQALGNNNTAVTDCDNSLALLPQYHKARMRRAHIYMAMGKIETAIRDLEKLCREAPTPEVEFELRRARTKAQRDLQRKRAEAFEKQQQQKQKEAEREREAQYNRRQTYNYSQFFNHNHPNGFSRNGSFNFNERTRQSDFFGRSKARQSENHTYSSHRYNTRSSAKKPKRTSKSEGSSDSFYTVLGITPRASKSTIKKAYKKMALKMHPDKNKSPSAESKFKKIVEAYGVLSSPSKKRTYDSKNLF